MNISKAFSYIGEDEMWVNRLGWGALVFIVPILNFAALGYIIELIANVWQGEKRPLPEWNNIGKKMGDGFKLFAVIFLYMLPVLILYFGLSAIFFFQMMNYDYEAVANSGIYATEPFFAIGWGVMALCLMPYQLIIGAMYPMFFAQLVRHRTIKSCFDFREIWFIIKARPGEYLIIIGIFIGLYMASMIVIMPAYLIFFIPCLGWIVGMLIIGAVYMLILFVFGHLVGQFLTLIDPPIKPEPAMMPIT